MKNAALQFDNAFRRNFILELDLYKCNIEQIKLLLNKYLCLK